MWPKRIIPRAEWLILLLFLTTGSSSYAGKHTLEPDEVVPWLPPDIWTKIGHYCNNESLQRLALVSKGHYKITAEILLGYRVERTIRTPEPISVATVSPDGSLIAVGMLDGRIGLYESTTQNSIEWPAHHGSVTSAKFSPDGTQLLTTSGNAIRVWDPKTGEQLRMWNLSREVIWSPDGSRLIVLGFQSRTVTIRKADTSEVIARIEGGIVSPPDLTAFHGSRVLVCSRKDGDRHSVEVWDTETGQYVETLKHLEHPDAIRVSGASYSADGKQIGVCYSDGVFGVWSAETKECLWSKSGNSLGELLPKFSPDGNLIFGNGYGPQGQILDSTTGHSIAAFQYEMLPSPFKENRMIPQFHAFISDGRRILIQLHVSEIWDLQSGELRWSSVGFRGTESVVEPFLLFCSTDGGTLVFKGLKELNVLKAYQMRQIEEIPEIKHQTPNKD